MKYTIGTDSPITAVKTIELVDAIDEDEAPSDDFIDALSFFLDQLTPHYLLTDEKERKVRLEGSPFNGSVSTETVIEFCKKLRRTADDMEYIISLRK